MNDTICFYASSHLLLTVQFLTVFFSLLIPKRSISVVNIAHVISQRLCHSNFQSLCVVKTSVRITNTHPETATLN